MATASIIFPVAPKRQTKLRLKNDHAGNPHTASIVVPLAPTMQTSLAFQNACAGSSVTATLPVLRSPSHLAELQFENRPVGNHFTATIAVHGPLKQTCLQWRHGRAGSPENATLAFYRLPTQTATATWSSARHTYATATVSFHNNYKNYITSSILYRYDWKVVYGTVFRYRHRSLVQGGWRIVAKNLESGQVHEIGFISSDDPIRILENISLPDGEYEISVLTSSLFWKDSMDGNVRTISVRPGGEISPFPTIYNLRSSVQSGTTIIQWSASRREIEDCLFGAWYSSEPFLGEATNGSDSFPRSGSSDCLNGRLPDATVWYSSLMTEYQTSFNQNAPAYVAVAAIRSGNDSEKGKVHELFLDWSNIPPRAPDDVIVLSEPLPAIDPEILNRNVEDLDLGLVF